ncbi:MAG: ABC transporter substrate-binding protein [Bacillota bacterium]
MKRFLSWAVPGCLLLLTIGTVWAAGRAATNNQVLTKVTVLLDWVPNTNHTGLYVAKDLGFYKKEGLEVKIIQPSEGDTNALVAAGKGEFGIGFQEQITYARTAEHPLPVKAIAAIIQHNTSGFASPAAKNIKSPKDFVGKIYGGGGSPMEEAMLKSLMQKYGVDFKKLRMVNTGAADFLASVQKEVDFCWIYYGWEGIAAKLKHFPINYIQLRDIDPRLDYYTPVIVASDNLLRDKPDLVKKFLRATAEGYRYSIKNPAGAAGILVKNAPEIDRKLALASQKYLAKEYIADAKRWGEMKESVWNNYSEWMYENGLLKKKLRTKEAFTNEFLPAW